MIEQNLWVPEFVLNLTYWTTLKALLLLLEYRSNEYFQSFYVLAKRPPTEIVVKISHLQAFVLWCITGSHASLTFWTQVFTTIKIHFFAQQSISNWLFWEPIIPTWLTRVLPSGLDFGLLPLRFHFQLGSLGPLGSGVRSYGLACRHYLGSDRLSSRILPQPIR